MSFIAGWYGRYYRTKAVIRHYRIYCVSITHAESCRFYWGIRRKKQAHDLEAKVRKYQGMFERHSRKNTSFEKDWSQQVEHRQVPNGRDQVSGGVSVPCRHATLFANALWKTSHIHERGTSYC